MRERNQRGAIAWMAGNPVAANLIMLVCLVGGLIMTTQIKQEIFPEFESDTVVVSVAYPGASPEEVEQGIVLAVVSELSTPIQNMAVVTNAAGE
jgi:multidrug efflux pump subunit AcrB